jgi:hypothetical protein
VAIRILDAELPGSPISRTFLGRDHGGVPVSFFIQASPRGHGPGSHRHPYAEVFVLHEGSGSFAAAGIEVVRIPPRAPRANAFAERWVRTVRRECLDWTLIWNQRQLRRVLTEYLRHYNTVRRDRTLQLQPPASDGRLTLVEPFKGGPVERVDVLGGLIHEYRRAA